MYGSELTRKYRKRITTFQMKMNSKDLKSAIENYLKTPNFDYSILVTGEWGSGKTYYFKNCLVDETTGSINNTNAAIILVSVGGLTATDQVKENIGIELISKYGRSQFLNNEKINLIFSDDIASFLPEAGKKAFKAAKYGIHSYRSYSQHNIQSHLSARLLLIIDDLERYKGDIPGLLAFINNRYVNNGIHVVYITNEQKLNTLNKYKEWKEKYIRYTFSFSVSIHDVLQQLIISKNKGSFCKISSTKHDIIANWISAVKITNLRTIILAIDCFDFIEGGHTEEDKEYLFELILLHADFITQYTGEQEMEDEEYNKYLKDKSLSAGFIYHDFFSQYKNEFPYQSAISNFIHSGYISPIEKEKMLDWFFPANNKYSQALVSLRDCDVMEKDELLKTISFVLEGIDQMQIPYEQLTTVANWLEALYRYFPEDLDDLNFKNKILDAIKSNYPGKNEYFAKRNKPKCLIEDGIMPFTHAAYDLMINEYNVYQEVLHADNFRKAFEASNSLKYYEAYGDFKGEIFPMICKCQLLPKLKELNNRGISNLDIEQYNLNDKMKDQTDYIRQVLIQLKQDVKNESYDSYAKMKREELISSLNMALEKY